MSTFPIDSNRWYRIIDKCRVKFEKAGIRILFPIDLRYVEYLNKQEEKYFAPVSKLVYDDFTEQWVEPEVLAHDW